MVDSINNINLSAFNYLILEKDILLVLIQLLETKFWLREFNGKTYIFIDGKF